MQFDGGFVPHDRRHFSRSFHYTGNYKENPKKGNLPCLRLTTYNNKMRMIVRCHEPIAHCHQDNQEHQELIRGVH